MSFSNLLPEKEQIIMKYQGITIHKSPYANTWFTRYRINGKQYFISAKTQKECYDKLKKALKQQDVTVKAKTMPTLLQWYSRWLELYKIGKVKQSTIYQYEQSLKKIDVKIKNKAINSITLEELLTNLNAIKEERARQLAYELLKSLFQKAKDNDYVESNLIEKIDKPEHIRKNGKAFTHAEEEKLIKAFNSAKWGDFYLVMLFQGLRKGECLGLTMADVDFAKNTLSINKSINRHNQIDTTKNEQSNRIMPLFNTTKEILTKYKNIKGRIFNISYNQIDEHTKEIKKETGISFSTKFMRYTFITRCGEQSIPEFVIQSWVGHKIGSKVTKQVYTKFNAEDNGKYIDILNASELYSNYTQK